MEQVIDTRITTAILHEVFSGIQGEGVLVGVRQIFVRFHGCNLSCAYCDTPASRQQAPEAVAVEQSAGSRSLSHHRNPLTVPDLVQIITHLQRNYPHHSVSLTGGEPLLHRAYLDELIPALHAAELHTMLETNGVLATEMTQLAVLPCYIAMDIKLPSVAGLPPQWDRHRDFLHAVAARCPELSDSLQVKLVFGEASLADVAQAAALIAAIHPSITCVLQPVTPHRDGVASPSTATVLAAQAIAAATLRDVRVIPQTHVMLGQW